jgi:hypothetical protein
MPVPTSPADSDWFTQDKYREIVRAAKRRFAFEPYGTTAEHPHVLWRHDIDISVHRALKIAELEAEEEVSSTYFFLLTGMHYNLLQPEIRDRARRVLALGHDLGLHFEMSAYGELTTEEALAERLEEQAKFLSGLLEQPVVAFSFHDPDLRGGLGIDADEIGGLANAYGATLKERYTYVSDSNGYWRSSRLPDLIESGRHERLHVLTHPIWWPERPMAPRDRVLRAIRGRAQATIATYDELLERGGRANLR